ncbi:MAG: hypothetical protein PHX51_07350 [Clostridia bacterium]|nr:hypothetical protein [Clostridia bacterium]
MVFAGTYMYQLDGKNRLRLPPRYKDYFGSEFYITIDVRGALILKTAEEMAEIQEKLRVVPLSDLDAQDAVNLYYSNSYEITLDDQRRFVLPARLKQYAKIDKDVAVVGLPKGLCLWSAEVWENYNVRKEEFGEFDREIAPKLRTYGV